MSDAFSGILVVNVAFKYQSLNKDVSVKNFVKFGRVKNY